MNNNLKLRSILCALLFLSSLILVDAQDPCDQYTGGYFGLSTEDIESASLAVIPNDGGFYLGGIKNDSALIIRFDVLGKIVWARTMDVVPNMKDNISSLIVDSDQMLIIGGTNGPIGVGDGGPVYILKYDPMVHQVLWATEFIPNADRNYCWSVIELAPDGNYLMSNNQTDDSVPNVDVELLEISRATGMPVAGKNTAIHLGGSEDITNMFIHQGSIYGTGRFTDGLPNNKMRTTLIKMDADDRDIQWVKLGHRPGNQSARLYGVDLTLNNDFLYVCSIGDPSGTSTSNTRFYVQKFTIDGDFLWLKEYDFPGNNDWAYEMINQPDGLVIMGAQKAAPQQFILFKIDFDGNFVWATSFPTGEPINTSSPLIGDSQLIQIGDKLVFTGYTASHVLLIMTDLRGKPLNACIPYQSISIPVNTISTAAFYSVSALVSVPGFTIQPRHTNPVTTYIHVDPLCITPAEIITHQSVTICEGEAVQGYMDTGIYLDTFYSVYGCDSIRTLDLTVLESVQDTFAMTICSGQQYMGYETTGIYQDTFLSISGCDSIRVIELQVENAIQNDVALTICTGTAYMGYTVPGMYQDTFLSSRGCDSIRVLELEVEDVIYHNLSMVICAGGAYWGYTATGTYQDTFASFQGCDSIRILNLLVTDIKQTNISISICEGEQYLGYSQSGTYQDTFISIQGCDSIRTLNLTVLSTPISFKLLGLCEATRLHHFSPGIYQDTFLSVFGCDSIARVEVKNGDFYIPNIFSPNDDDVNDHFEIIQSQYSDVVLTYFALFDRYGNMAYQTKQWPVRWDGTNKNGRIYNPGVFTYTLRYACGDHVVTDYGNVTLIR